MSWRDRHPAPRRLECESEEEYVEALEEWYDAEDDAADDYVERQMESRHDC